MKYIFIFVQVLFFVFLSADIDLIDNNEALLNKYLAGSAKYCEKLKTEAFHFICIEKIFIANEELIMESIQPERRKIRRKKYRKNYLFDYQIISKNRKVSEQRKKRVGSSKDQEIDPSKLLLFFLMEKSVFGPNSILDKEKQSQFNFKVAGKENIKKREFIVVEASPRKPGNIFFSSAKIYIDAINYSIRRIKVVPTFMKGYKIMERTASKFKSKLLLKCDMYFDHEYNGLFFPTNIRISERYKGGAFIFRNMGTNGWEKSQTVFKYYNYKFFKVDTEVKIQE